MVRLRLNPCHFHCTILTLYNSFTGLYNHVLMNALRIMSDITALLRNDEHGFISTQDKEQWAPFMNEVKKFSRSISS